MSDHDPTYAAKLAALLRRAERPRRTFIDGGACRGDFSALLAGEFPGATIHAFEPNAALCGDIERRFAGNPDFHLWNRALHERAGRIELQVHADPGTTSLLPRPAGDRRYFHSSDRVVASQTVDTATLDDFLAAHVPEGVALLKLDTQGAELSILRGAARSLQAQSIEVIYTEFFLVPHYEGAPLLNDLWDLLAGHGYSMFDLFKGPYAANGQLRFGDAIFVSPRYRAECLDTFPAEA